MRSSPLEKVAALRLDTGFRGAGLRPFFETTNPRRTSAPLRTFHISPRCFLSARWRRSVGLSASARKIVSRKDTFTMPRKSEDMNKRGPRNLTRTGAKRPKVPRSWTGRVKMRALAKVLDRFDDCPSLRNPASDQR